MKIAFTHNLQLSTSEDEAEFDRPETVAAITEALRALGHEVEPIDVAGPASRIVARLEALAPDLVFNTAEGSRGRFREAFYPALFDRLGLPFTMSDAYVCALTLDKQLTKMVLAARGVPTPHSVFVERREQIELLAASTLRFPVIVKPNFEGSSMGITQDSIVENALELAPLVESLLQRFPTGVLVEEFIVGQDITVPFLEKAAPKRGGVLEPAQYCFDEAITGPRRYQIYDYDLKATHFDAVSVRVPAQIDASIRDRAFDLTRRVIAALGVRDAGRVDFRLDAAGELHFIEVNALPSLEPGASIYESAALVGLGSIEKVLQAIISSAADRFGITLKSSRRSFARAPIQVGLIYNLRRMENRLDEATGDDEAEFDSPDTVAAIEEAIASYGHNVVRLEATRELPSILPASGIDVAFNVAEGIEGRTRESQVPALLELLGIPYTGSDPATLSLSHDKGLAKRLIAQAGLRTPPFLLMTTGRERLPKGFEFPVIAKPVAEGSSKGVLRTSVAEDEKGLRELVQEIVGRYHQALIVEHFLPGREFTVALLGERRPRALPPMEVIFLDRSPKYLLYTFESKFFNVDKVRFEVPANVEPPLKRELERVAKSAFTVLGCRDFARIDLRLDEKGHVHFVECNPLPGLTPGFSDFCVIAEAVGIGFRALVGEIMAPALRRMRERRREQLLGRRG